MQVVDPVQYSILQGGHGEKVGYMRIVVFSDTVPASVSAALDDMVVRIRQ